MTRPGRVTAAIMLALAFAAGVSDGASGEQAPPPPSKAPSPAESNPLPTTTAPDPAGKTQGGQGAPTPHQAIGLPAPSSTKPAAPVRSTLVPDPASLDEVDEVSLPAKPAAILTATTTWEGAVPAVRASFQKIEAELAKAGIAPAGRPLVVFDKTAEDSFEYEAMIPIAAAPAQPPADAEGLRYGSTPSGKALRFRHSGTYDEIDGTYETLTAYLYAKEVTVKEEFIEEYVTDLEEGAEAKVEVNIYALTK